MPDGSHKKVGGKWGIINRKGEEIICAKYESVRVLTPKIIAANIGGNNQNGLYAIGGKWGLLNDKGIAITEFKYTHIYDYFRICDGFYEDNNSEIYLDFNTAIFNIGGRLCREGNRVAAYGGLWGRFDLDGNEIGEPFPAGNVFGYGLMDTRINTIYQKFLEWKERMPDEIDVWLGDCHLTDDISINQQTLLEWHKWKELRDAEDLFIKINIPLKHEAQRLIDIDAIKNAYDQFIMEENISRLIRIASLSDHYPEINCISIDGLRTKYNNIYNRLLEDSVQTYLYTYRKIRKYLYRLNPKKYFDNKIIQHLQDGTFELPSHKPHRTHNDILEFYRDEFEEIDIILKITEWFNNGHQTDFKKWAIDNNFWKNSSGYLRNGYAALYQSVWWKRYLGINYWDSDRTKLHYPEFRRRLLYNKLKLLVSPSQT